jgi:hypothetical protein
MQLSDDSAAQVLIGPADLITTYMQKNRLKSFVDNAIKTMQVPVFLPVTRNAIELAEEEEDAIDPAATILVHAAQILLFAPRDGTKTSSTLFLSTMTTATPVNQQVNLNRITLSIANYQAQSSQPPPTQRK